MDEQTPATCPRCGARISTGSRLGALCPRCLVLLAVDAGEPAAAPADAPGTSFGPYRLVRPLGEGGMGIVWLGEQESPIRRTVAVKVVKPGADSEAVLSRFESERQTLAILNHEHIAKVFDAGVTEDGRPYFVMEYIVGLAINAFADRERMPIAARLQLFLQVCGAVHHAHQKGVLHRDLKPTNILVSDQDGRPVVKVIDFGIAKAIGERSTGRTMATGLGVLVGTPEYMSPEQASLSESTADTRTDIYSLGLVLYELLVGAPPFDARELRERGLFEMLRVIREEEPKRLTTKLTTGAAAETAEVARTRHTELGALVRQLRGDLEWIAAHALEKDPGRRYASASELGADVERHLKGEAVLVGPPSALYRLRKLAYRHRAAAVALVVVAIAISASAVASTLSLVRARRAENQTRRQLTASLVAQGMRKVDEFDPLTGLVYLTRALELETDPVRIRSHRIRIGETLQRSPRLLRLWRHDAAIHMMTFSSRGLVATGSTDGDVKIRDLATGELRGLAINHGGPIWDGEFSPDGATLAVASEDGRLKLWDPATGKLLREFAHQTGVVDIAFSPDGALVAAICRDGRISVWDIRRGALGFAGEHLGEGRRVVFSSAGTLLATAGQDGARLWHVPKGTPVGALLHQGAPGVMDVAFAKDDRWLATAGWDQSARFWDARTAQPAGYVMRHDAGVTSVMFTDDSRVLVTTSLDATTRTWRVPDGTSLGPPRISASIASGTDVSHDFVIASATQGGPVDLWSLDGGRAGPSLPHGGQVMARFDPTGRFLTTAGFEGLVRVWDLAPVFAAPPRLAADEGGFYWRVVASPDNTSAAVSTGNAPQRGSVRVFDVSTGAPVTPAMRFWATNIGLAFSPDGRKMVSAAGQAGLRVWDVGTGEPSTPLIKEDVPIDLASFAPSGETLVVGGGAEFGTSGAVRVRDSSDAGPRTGLLRHNALVHAAWFSPDGARLLTVAEEVGSNVKVWDAVTGRLMWSARHSDGVLAATWSPDGTTVWTGGLDQRVRSWSASSGSPEATMLKMMGTVTSMALTRDGARIVVGTDGGNVQLADLAHGAQPLSVMSHRGLVYQSVFNLDGTLTLTSAGDQTARLWDGLTGEPLTPSLAAGAISRDAAFLNGGRAWAWTGMGVFVDELSVDDRSPEQLRLLAESTAARALSASGSEIALSADEVDARFATTGLRASGPPPAAPADYHRAQARDAWGRLLFAEVVASTERLRAQNEMQWPDRMRLVGAYVLLNRWQDALGELRAHQSRWSAAPELLYMEAVALNRIGDQAGSARLCRAALDVTRGTRHPERAYWAARACLVQPTVAEADLAEIEEQIEIAYERFASNLARPELKGALLLRTDRSQEAFSLLHAAVPPASTIRPALLLVAAAAARSGRRADALTWLAAADRLPRPTAYWMMRPWLEAEADGLREEVVRSLPVR